MAAESLNLLGPAAAHTSALAVAYSGGLDSTVLLHLLHGRTPPGRLRALHVHHGLQAAAEDWAAHCLACGKTQGVPVQILRVKVENTGQGPEAAARTARYVALAAQLRPGEVLVTAQHADDQAETLLLNLCRGSGVRGLAAMPVWSEFAPGFLWRPLLQTPRAALRAYAAAHGLSWIEDPHNADPAYARSRLRKTGLPVLREQWPGLIKTLGRTAERMAEASELLQELGLADLAGLRADVDHALSVAALRRMTAARRRNALRCWIDQRGLPAPFQHSLERVDAEMLSARADADPVVAWPGADLRRYRDRLYAMPTLEPPMSASLAWDGRTEVLLPGASGRVVAGPGGSPAGVLRMPRPGERFRPLGASHRRSLKNLFQERGVPTWVRERTPVLECAGSAVWIGGIGPSADFRGAEPRWLCRLPGYPITEV